jgi:hypothetical protein
MTHNGFKNYNTWNVALYLNNDETLHNIAKTCQSYDEFAQKVGKMRTLDGVRFNDKKNLDYNALNNIIKEIKGE